MAGRCGCANDTCNCLVEAGDGITVTGNGQTGSPYVVSADPTDAITVSDTNSVDMTKSGNNIRADVIRDPSPTNILTIGPNGVGVECEAVQDCVGAAMNAGCGLTYDDATNTASAEISPTAGNTIVCLPDGLFSAPGAFSCDSLAACSVNALNDVDTVTDPPDNGDLFIWNGTQWVPRPVGCGLTSGPTGLVLDLTDFATLTRRTANDNIDIPGGSAALAGACNLQGQPIYCDTAGNLRTKPEKFADSEVSAINEGYSPANSIPFTTSTITATLVNPSSCYAMCGIVYLSAILQETSTGNSNPETFFQFDLGDGAGFQEFGVRMRDTRGISSVSQERTRFSAPLSLCLDPGETKNVQFRVRWAQGPVVAGGTTQIIAAAREIRWFGVNI